MDDKPWVKPTIEELTERWYKPAILQTLLEDASITDLRLIRHLVQVELDKKLRAQESAEE
jgi:hypothetical protein